MPIEYEVSTQGEDVCIECYSVDSCVAIIHQNISQLNLTDGFLNISLISLINSTTNNGTVYKCFSGYNLIDYQVGVILHMKLDKNQTLISTEFLSTYTDDEGTQS